MNETMLEILFDKEAAARMVKTQGQDFPSGPVVKNPPSSAGDAGLIPGWGTKIPHAAGQLSPRVSTREKPTHHNEEPACRN